jgi:acyl dehydratase
MPVPPSERYFEDYVVGESMTYGDYVVTEEEIRGFAERYDPQPFHIDPEAARQSIFGGLIASGWNTASISMRMLVDHFVSRRSGLGSPGIDELRWHQPVRPGDRLKVRSTVTEARRSKSKPDRGLVRVRHETLNQRDEVVMSFSGMSLYRCRDDGS